MTLTINIIKTADTDTGCWHYRNSESGKLVGLVKKNRNRPGQYFWEFPGYWGNNPKEEEAHNELQEQIKNSAFNLGLETNFIYHNF